jgi:hypothetical protein
LEEGKEIVTPEEESPSENGSPGWWQRNRDLFIVGLLIALVVAWVSFVTNQVARVTPPKVRDLEESINDLSEENRRLEGNLGDLKCYIYEKERADFFRSCIPSPGQLMELLPGVGCRVGEAVQQFHDPLPQIKATCR